MFGLGTQELIIVAVMVIFVFGASRLPEIGKGLGKAIKEFKNAGKELESNPGEKIKDKE